MEKDEKYIAMLYEKIVYDAESGIFIFKPIEVMTDCVMDFQTNVLTSKTKKSYLSMEDEVLAFSEENYCYGYPILQADLEEQFSNLDLQDITKEYYMSLIDSIIFGMHDAKGKKMKIVYALKDEVTTIDDEDWFFNFELEETDEQEFINIPINTFEKLIKQIDQKEYDTVRNFFNNINFLHEKFTTGKLTNIETVIEKQISSSKTDTDQHNSRNKKANNIDDLIDLQEVKEEIKKLSSYLKFLSKSKAIAQIDSPNLHMVFTGNPGTGKTTVARIISHLLYDMGYLRNDKFIEITPKDMIAEYVGQTGPKAAKCIQNYEGGLIFIDEAYAFNMKAQEFGQEAIVEIIKEMEKNDTVFIFAGYKEEMKGFVNSNPGITSRVGYFINFPDYSNEELYQILEQKVHRAKMAIEPNFHEKVYPLFEKARNFRNFGNGRFVDKLFQKLLLEHAMNTEKYRSKKKLITFTKEDLTDDMISKLLFEMQNEFFGSNVQEFEDIVQKITSFKTEEVLDQVIHRIISEKLYKSSYDIIRTTVENTIQEKSDNILKDANQYIKKIEHGKKDHPIGFKS